MLFVLFWSPHSVTKLVCNEFICIDNLLPCFNSHRTRKIHHKAITKHVWQPLPYNIYPESYLRYLAVSLPMWTMGSNGQTQGMITSPIIRYSRANCHCMHAWCTFNQNKWKAGLCSCLLSSFCIILSSHMKITTNTKITNTSPAFTMWPFYGVFTMWDILFTT